MRFLATPSAAATRLSVADALGANDGNDNTATGFEALIHNTSDTSNTANGGTVCFGEHVWFPKHGHRLPRGINQTTGNDNVYIGERMQGLSGESNA